jgi:hypothetical protein
MSNLYHFLKRRFVFWVISVLKYPITARLQPAASRASVNIFDVLSRMEIAGIVTG